MEWEVVFTDEFERWWNAHSEAEQDEIDAKVELLQEYGPTPRPHADTIASSRHGNMRELRCKCNKR
jgi:hypothetical protein